MEKGQNDSNEEKDLDLAKYSKYNDLLKPKKSDKGTEVIDGKKPSLTKFYVIIIAALLIGAYAFTGGFNNTGIFHNPSNSTKNPTNYGTIHIYDICINVKDLKSQTHYTLLITYRNQKIITIPRGAGIYSNCIRPLNVGGTPNVINVDIPNGYNGAEPTISDFFICWGIHFGPNSVMNYTGNITFKVNNEVRIANFLLFTPINGTLIELDIT